MNKICSKCKVAKPVCQFNRDGKSADLLQYNCKICENEIRRSLYSKKGVNPKSDYSRRFRSTLNGRAVQLTTAAKRRATDKGLSFNIHSQLVKHLISVGKCAKSGIPFDLSSPSKTGKNPFGPSIDRIISTKGYEPDNIQIVCNMFNTGKNEFDEIDFVAMCWLVAKNYSNKKNMIERAYEITQFRQTSR